ncbi:MAG TPA: hypothetical protein VE987_17110 [Polyangiaceae bacterium]|nr:hypothetical protein [Polyangiaceae bacterium]
MGSVTNARAVLGCALVGAACACTGGARSGGSASLGLAGCLAADASAQCAQPAPSYAHDIAPLLDRDCNGACHGADGGAWPLTEYEYVSDWASVIEEEVQQCAMPPADAGALSSADRALLVDWIACGASND